MANLENYKAMGEGINPYSMRNKLINGDHRINQRNNTQDINQFATDRWNTYDGATGTASWETGIVGAVDGIHSFLAINTTVPAADLNVHQRIEDVRTFSGQTVTFSFEVTTNTADPVEVLFRQQFGSGGSTTEEGTFGSITPIQVGTWEKHSLTVTIPSVIGKTIGDNSYLQITILCGTVIRYFSFSNAQLEEGLVATPFEVRPIGMELSLCQRYYWRGQADGGGYGFSWAGDTADGYTAGAGSFPATMRSYPTMAIITDPTYTNCTPGGFNQSQDGWDEKVTPLGVGTYRASNGVYEADAEI